MNPMTPTEDIRAARHKLSAAFGHDLDRIVSDLQLKQRESGHKYITLEPRPPIPMSATIKSFERNGG